MALGVLEVLVVRLVQLLPEVYMIVDLGSNPVHRHQDNLHCHSRSKTKLNTKILVMTCEF